MQVFFEGKLLKTFHENCSLAARISLRKDNSRTINLVKENKTRKKMYEEKPTSKRSIACAWYNALAARIDLRNLLVFGHPGYLRCSIHLYSCSLSIKDDLSNRALFLRLA